MYNDYNKQERWIVTMNDFQLKLILSILAAIMFSFIFIILAFSLPLDKKEARSIPKNKLEKVSQALRDR